VKSGENPDFCGTCWQILPGGNP